MIMLELGCTYYHVYFAISSATEHVTVKNGEPTAGTHLTGRGHCWAGELRLCNADPAQYPILETLPNNT